MKNNFLTIAFLLITWVAGAQSLEDAQRSIYYQRYHTAAQQLGQLITREPSNTKALYELVHLYILQNQMAKAADILSKAPQALSDEPWMRLAKGSYLLATGKSGEGQTLLQKAAEQTREKDPALLAAISKAFLQAGSLQGSQAIQWAEKALKRDKKNVSLMVLLGDAYRAAGNSTEAYKLYQQAMQQDGSYAEAYYRVGDIFLSQKNAALYNEYFQKAVQADPAYAPALYRLYAYEFYHNPATALQWYGRYMQHSDPVPDQRYDMADLLYLNKQYQQAVAKAEEIIRNEKDSTQPRIYRLLSYSWAGLNDTAKAISFMEQFLKVAADTMVIAKDYASLSQFFDAQPGQDSLALVYLAKAAALETDSTVLPSYYKRLAIASGEAKDFSQQARWLEKYYNTSSQVNNIDLFNWAVAHYRAGEYQLADSVFGRYVAKYPEQSFGYYWQARSRALQDPDMKAGIAVPAYQQLIAVLEKDSTDANYKKWMVEAYGYLAAYEANSEKDYAEAVDYFEKILEVDPDNAEAKKYIAILEAKK